MKPSTVKKIKELGLNPDEFTTEAPEDLTGRVVLVDPKLYGKSADRCLFKATGGFGCHLGCRGSCIFSQRIADGLEGRIERYEVIAVRKEVAS
jgi:hypothetical protein